jgi:hypothetical protein
VNLKCSRLWPTRDKINQDVSSVTLNMRPHDTSALLYSIPTTVLPYLPVPQLTLKQWILNAPGYGPPEKIINKVVGSCPKWMDMRLYETCPNFEPENNFVSVLGLY